MTVSSNKAISETKQQTQEPLGTWAECSQEGARNNGPGATTPTSPKGTGQGHNDPAFGAQSLGPPEPQTFTGHMAGSQGVRWGGGVEERLAALAQLQLCRYQLAHPGWAGP